MGRRVAISGVRSLFRAEFDNSGEAKDDIEARTGQKGEATVLQLDWTPSRNTRKIKSRTNQKGYDKSETTVGKLPARRVQIFRARFCIIHFELFFKKTFQIMSEPKFNQKNWFDLVEYSCTKVSGSSEVPRFPGINF